MPFAPIVYAETGDSQGHSSAGFAFANSRSTRKYVTLGLGGTQPPAAGFNIPVGLNSLQNLPLDFLGQIDLSPNASGQNMGGISRTCPASDHVYPYLYAEAVNNINGVGTQFVLPQIQALIPSVGNSLIFQEYEFQVEYTPRPYRVLPDSVVYVSPPSVGSSPGPANPYIYNDAGTKVTGAVFAHEEVRYTDYSILPAGQNITFKSGAFMKLRGTGAAADPMYPAQATIRLPDSSVKFTWYQVPYRYVTDINSNLLKFLGRVNQNPWYDLNYWADPANPVFKYPAGSLLYIGFDVQRYTPPFPSMVQYGGSSGTSTLTFGGGAAAQPTAPVTSYTAFSAEKLCDITFHFMYTTRINSTAGVTPAQGNWINAGWNCMPWYFNRKFFYATTVNAIPPGSSADTDTTTWYPTWLSFDFGYLFTDPQVTHG